jgi:SNF2 family DNA or RNA helicase
MKKLSLKGLKLVSDVSRVDAELTLSQDHGSSAVQLIITPTSAATSDAAHPGMPASLKWRGYTLSTANLPRVIDCLLEKDGLAFKDLTSGRSASFVIDLRSAPAKRLDPNPKILADYLLARATAAQYVVPFLFEPPHDLPLFAYQRVGVDWLCSKQRAILADDMGLGKTLQAIVAMRRLFFSGAVNCVLVVCPKSLISNWDSEIIRWAAELVHVRMVPSAPITERAWEAVLGSAHVLLTTYEQMRTPPLVLREKGVDLLVADEAHRIRNQDSLTAIGIRAVKATRFWALTGTPIERDTFDLATLLSIVSPKSCSPSDARVSPALVRSIARPFVLRRLKSEVLKQLPPVIENREVLELAPKQRRAYNMALETFKKTLDDRQMLALITRLRSICDYDPDSKESVKAIRILEILSDVYMAGEKAILFSHFTEPLQLMRGFLRKRFGDSSLRLLLGKQTMDERRDNVSDFKSLDKVHFLLASSRVGGEGLTLTEANHVIFFNEWWNPSSNDQARDRVVRVGQKKGVLVYTFVCRHTIEEMLINILKDKRATFEDVVNTLADKAADPDIATIRAELRHSLAQNTQ